jgi:thiosulfate/3-mercaptopyruvate sulfurtransferase
MTGDGRPGALVDPDWALGRLERPDVRFVEVSLDTAVYDGIHIPGAIAWDWMTRLSDPVRRDIVGREALSELLGSSGVGPGTHLVFYGDHQNKVAAWAYWLLKVYRFERVSLLDGGRKYWTDHHLPVLVTVLTHPRTEIDLPEPDPSVRASRDDILSRRGDPRLSLVDVRSRAESDGRRASTGDKARIPGLGHVAGAIPAPWRETLRDDGTFKDAATLLRDYAEKGITADRDVITFGEAGEPSAHSWFVLHELLGFPGVRNYDGF